MVSGLDEARLLGDLNTDSRLFIETLTLLVDIHYEAIYGEAIEIKRGRGYRKQYNDQDILQE